MIYKAEDGKEFKTEKECLEYEKNPTIYFVVRLCSSSISSDEKIVEIFLTKEEAEKYIEEIYKKQDNYFFKIRTKIFEKYKKETIATTKEESKLIEQKIKEINIKQQSNWKKILNYFKREK